MNYNIQAVINAIRNIDDEFLDEELSQIFDALGSLMASNGYSALDLEILDQANGLICGEIA